MMLGVIAGIHPSTDGLDMGAGALNSSAAIPLRLEQHRHVGPSLRAPPIAPTALAKAGWWTRLCELIFGW